ncbi:MAG: glyoxalase [Desulfobulbaceae bacterium]|nr:MAG: glyoxalase [Desulfobulbaceae bacterium]
MVGATAFAIPAGSIDYWQDRLEQTGVTSERERRMGENLLSFADPDGLVLELIETETTGDSDHQIIGFHSATALLRKLEPTEKLLTTVMGLKLHKQEGNRVRYVMENSEGWGTYYDVVVDPQAPDSRQGRGTVHHIAFRAYDDAQQHAYQQSLMSHGYPVSEVRDRNYFRSIYYQEPGGILFEIATDPPGFSVDEAPGEMGSNLMLPSQYETYRSEIETHLPKLREAGFIHQFVEPQNDEETTLITLHGTGGDEHDLLGLAEAIAPGTAVISPRGQVVEQGMNRFFARLAPNVLDEQDIRTRAAALRLFLVDAAGKYQRPVDQLVALGYSNGANMAAAMMLLYPELYNRAILLRPMLPLSVEPLPSLEGKEILVLRGRTDQVIPSASTDQLIALLEHAGAKIQLEEIAAGHELTQADLEIARLWLADTTRTSMVQ